MNNNTNSTESSSTNFDIYRVSLGLNKALYEIEFSNVISWELMSLKITKDELRGLADFINKYLENNNDQ